MPICHRCLAGGESLYVAFLAELPCQGAVDRLLAIGSDNDEFRVVDREVYLLYRQSVLKSKFTNSFFEKLGVPTTTRNWQTITKLVQMARVLKK